MYSTFVVCLLIGAHSLAFGRDTDWANDPRSLSLTTEGLEDLLPVHPDQPNPDGFGELLGEWTWTELGIPGDYAGAGVSIDYPYLYLSNQDYHRVYVIDISTGIPNTLLWFDAPGIRVNWGLGMDNDQELWVGDVWHWQSRAMMYEMTSYPPVPSATGDSIDARLGSAWMADITDNVPCDTIYMVRVPSYSHKNFNIFGFHEPSGELGREIGDSSWNYISQRGLTYNRDDGTLIVGGWNTGQILEISIADGSPIPGRQLIPTTWEIAGLAYQDEECDGIPKIWVQMNRKVDLLQVYHFPLLGTCDPVEPWSPKTQGYWRRKCKDDTREDICAYVDDIHALADLFDLFDCDSIRDLMDVGPPENDMCRKARRQFMALLLNIASGKLAVCNCLEDGREVGDAVAEIDSLLVYNPSFHTCEYAETLADDINNGISIVPCDITWAPAPPMAVQLPNVSATPNPFAKSTVIEYELKVPGPVRLEIYDKTGRPIRTLVDGHQSSGIHRIGWNGLDNNGRAAPSGVYFSQLQTGDGLTTKTLVCLR